MVEGSNRYVWKTYRTSYSVNGIRLASLHHRMWIKEVEDTNSDGSRVTVLVSNIYRIAPCVCLQGNIPCKDQYRSERMEKEPRLP